MINCVCIQIPMGNIFHPHTRTQCLPDPRVHYPLGRHVRDPKKSGYFQIWIAPSLRAGRQCLWYRSCAMLWVPIYSCLLSMPEVENSVYIEYVLKHFFKSISSHDVFENLIACQHFKIGKFHIKIQISSLSAKGRRARDPKTFSSSVAKQQLSDRWSRSSHVATVPTTPYCHMPAPGSFWCLPGAIPGQCLFSWWWTQLYKVLGQCLTHHKHLISISWYWNG